MEDYLVFRLFAPMAAWGEIAVGKDRRSATYPSRSAILGLVSAAMGIKRDESKKLSALFAGYDVAVKVLSPGTLLTDYHTIQVPDSVGTMTYATRRDEIVIGRKRLGTILSTREYRCDALYVIALRTRTNAPYPLGELKDHLSKPRFVLYLGRKSCPLGAPLFPQVTQEAGFRAALDNTKFPPLLATSSGVDVTGRYIVMLPPRYYWEGDARDMQPQMTHERYDVVLSRTRWQFAPRQEHMMASE